MGATCAKQKKCGQIVDAEQIRIDSAPLYCPICLLIFRKAPEVLPCGHSHCQDCLRRMEKYARGDIPNRDSQISIECSLCRARCPLNRQRIKNYAIEAIIESLSTINEAEDPTNEIIAAKNIAIKRMVQNERELDGRVRELEAKVERATRTVLLVFGFAMTYFGLRLTLWVTQSAIII